MVWACGETGLGFFLYYRADRSFSTRARHAFTRLSQTQSNRRRDRVASFNVAHQRPSRGCLHPALTALPRTLLPEACWSCQDDARCDAVSDVDPALDADFVDGPAVPRRAGLLPDTHAGRWRVFKVRVYAPLRAMYLRLMVSSGSSKQSTRPILSAKRRPSRWCRTHLSPRSLPSDTHLTAKRWPKRSRFTAFSSIPMCLSSSAQTNSAPLPSPPASTCQACTWS